MATSVGDAHGARELSHRLRREAQSVAETAHVFDRAMERSDSRGLLSFGRRFLSSVQPRQVRRLEHDMNELARIIREHAEWVERTESELRYIERRVREWVAANPHDPTTPDPDASLVPYFPHDCSFDWYDVWNRLKRNGVWL